MGSRGSIDWWRAGGAPEPIAVYQPIGAASLEASYVNLVNPGTFDAAPGVAPTHLPATGWGFNGTTQYLLTGIVPTNNQQWAMVIRFSESQGVNSYLAGVRMPTPDQAFAISPRLDAGGANRIYALNGGSVFSSPSLLGGVLAVAADRIYRNGTDEGVSISAPTADPITAQIHIGARNNNGVNVFYFRGNIQAVAIYPTSTDHAAWVPAVSAAMVALTG